MPRSAPVGLLLALLVLLAGCRSAPESPSSGGGERAPTPTRTWNTDGPPDVIPPGLENQPDPVPQVEPRSERGNPKTYRVFGKTYRTMDSADGYYATGLASWYGRKFHGRSTSSGEPYDMLKLTAAHRALPLPTYLRVTNLENGRTTLVRVNDRGPFHSDRIIDLSFGAAYKLGFAHRGTARVRLEVWSPDETPAAQARTDRVLAEVPAPPRRFVLQAGAFRNLASADALKASLERLTGSRAYVVRVSDEALYRVRLGPVENEAEALRLRSLIMDANLGEPMIIRE